jgi:hypothetical protein
LLFIFTSHAQWPTEVIANNVPYPGAGCNTDYINQDNKQDVVIADGDSLYWCSYPDWSRNFIDIFTSSADRTDPTILDMDIDGDNDFIIYRPDQGNIYWYENVDGNGLQWTQHHIIDMNKQIGLIYYSWGDLDEDYDMDIVIQDFEADSVLWLENVYDGVDWTLHMVGYMNFANYSYCAVADLVGDTKLDIVSGTYSPGNIIIYENQLPDTTWQQHPVDTFLGASFIQCADIDNDNMLDIVINNILSGQGGLFYYQNPTWTKSTILSGMDELLYFGVEDIDGDLDNDISFSTGSGLEIRWAENPGDGTTNWEHQIIGTLPDFAILAVLADIDGDNFADVVSANIDFTNNISSIHWYENPHLPDTLHVPADYPTIQAAIDASADGNVVLVADGLYYENINYRGKAITVASHFLIDGNESHIENTIIDGSQPSNPDSGTVVMFKSGEDTNSILCGFTITGGNGTFGTTDLRAGGGIVLYQSGAKIKNNIIEFNIIENVPWAYGGAIFTSWTNNYSDIIVKDNVIRNNECNGNDFACGGGIVIRNQGYALISNNKIIENSISASIISSGGGIECWGPIGEIYIVNNYIKGNSVQTNNYGGGGINISECNTNPPIIENNIIVDNYSSKYGGGILIDLNLDNSFKPGLNPHPSTTENVDALGEQFLVNNTIYNNSAVVSGGGFYPANNMTANIVNCIVWGNTAPSNPQIAGTVNVVYSNVEGGFTGEGNIDDDPLFLDTLYRLSNSSPCLEKGIDSIDIGGTMYYCPPFCYHGVPRPSPSGTMPDIGACENENPVGVNTELSLIPKEYSLEQNYPNPFNPNTTIKYQIPELSFVTLKVYDVLGSEITTLVNEEKPVGSYEVEFDATTLPSGIYFYRLQVYAPGRAGSPSTSSGQSFVETKKMVLLR